jgi:hypothetical protein
VHIKHSEGVREGCEGFLCKWMRSSRVLGSIPVSPDIEESEGRQMKSCGIKW